MPFAGRPAHTVCTKSSLVLMGPSGLRETIRCGAIVVPLHILAVTARAVQVELLPPIVDRLRHRVARRLVVRVPERGLGLGRGQGILRARPERAVAVGWRCWAELSRAVGRVWPASSVRPARVLRARCRTSWGAALGARARGRASPAASDGLVAVFGAAERVVPRWTRRLAVSVAVAAAVGRRRRRPPCRRPPRRSVPPQAAAASGRARAPIPPDRAGRGTRTRVVMVQRSHGAFLSV